MSDTKKIRFGLWYDFRNPPQWRQPYDRLYGEILDQVAWAENNGFDDCWLSEHHFIEDGYLPSMLPAAAAIAARTKRIRIPLGVLLMPFHNPVRLAEDIAVVDAISGGRIRSLIASNDQEKTFNEAADHMNYQTNNYVAWAEKAGQNRNPVYIRDRAHLRETGSFKVADPATCVKMIREYLDKVPLTHYYSWTLPPGLPPKWIQPHLELFASKVLPAFRSG